MNQIYQLYICFCYPSLRVYDTPVQCGARRDTSVFASSSPTQLFYITF